jgi:hypothetical protein
MGVSESSSKLGGLFKDFVLVMMEGIIDEA